MVQSFSRRVIARHAAAGLAADPSGTRRLMRQIAAYLIKHKAAGEAKLVVNDIAREIYASRGLLFAEVISAHELDGGLKSKLEKYLLTITGAKSVALKSSVDPSLVGGLIVRLPDAELDLSLRSKLNKIAAIS